MIKNPALPNNYSSAQVGDCCKKEMILAKDHAIFSFLYGKYALMITSLEPENDLHLIFDLFEFNIEYPLVAIGNWNSSPYSQALYAKYHNHKMLHLIEPQLHSRTLNMLRSNCYVYIDAHHQVDDKNTLTEAMYLQLPVIAYASNYNKKLTEDKALYYKSVSHLLDAIKSLYPNKASENSTFMKIIIDQKIQYQKQYSELV
ncbi:MAG: hypothetical protein EAZ13_02145 [Sphingobacteriia bacterium]|nr:MAG: hypothetical protein EAZ41_09330 [Sphingobacteriia bacterium]TAG30945.1 MAG: hypothetical protein EAZ35_05255 [Sphingobacteriia bacterium]TAH08805.1 MAG: hypothetical protein EAZ13_02145 [Sphingobacteriia bacterium]